MAGTEIAGRSYRYGRAMDARAGGKDKQKLGGASRRRCHGTKNPAPGRRKPETGPTMQHVALKIYTTANAGDAAAFLARASSFRASAAKPSTRAATAAQWAIRLAIVGTGWSR